MGLSGPATNWRPVQNVLSLCPTVARGSFVSGLTGLVGGRCDFLSLEWLNMAASLLWNGPCGCLSLGGHCGDVPVSEIAPGMSRFPISSQQSQTLSYFYKYSLCVGSWDVCINMWGEGKGCFFKAFLGKHLEIL